LIPFGLAFQTLGLSSLTGTRAALTLLLCMLGGRFGLIQVPPDLAFATELPALAGVLALAVVEEFLERDHDFAELLSVLRYGTSGAAGFIAAAGLARIYEAAGHVAPPTWLAGIVGVVLSAGTFWLRRQVHLHLTAASAGLRSPRTWLSRLELGASIGLGLAILAAPVVGLVFVVGAALLSGAVIAVAAALERARRRECPACGHRARVEASLCPSCRAPLPIERRLAGGVRLAV